MTTILEWQTIETVPRDGTKIDLWCSNIGRVTDCMWDGCWLTERDGPDDIAPLNIEYCGAPTHWMKPPEPPQ